MARWVITLVGAFGLAALATPLVRRLALATGFLDRPAPHKAHPEPVPYLGGVAVTGSVLAALLAAANVSARVAVFAVAALAVAAVGLADDRRQLKPSVRLAAQAMAAGMVAAAGVRADVTGLLLVDLALTMLWIVGVTNALNLLDNMDGLAAGTAAVAASGALALAALAGQPMETALAAALAGACAGFLLYNRRPASIFMGDAGSLFLGFSLAVLALEVRPVPQGMARHAAALMLLGLPLLDTVTVVVARLRHRRPVAMGGRDHLSHRLVALGVPPGRAVTVLVAAEAGMVAVAVAAGRSWLPVAVALGLAGVSAAVLVAVTARAAVYPTASARPRPA